MHWSEIAEGVWTIPRTRTKNHREHALPLTPQMLALLPERIEGRDLVFGLGLWILRLEPKQIAA